jgi:hypothetical protein
LHQVNFFVDSSPKSVQYSSGQAKYTDYTETTK